MTQYPNSYDDNTTLPPASGEDANSINANIAATEAIEYALGLLPAGPYASVRTRLDILESRINNPYSPSPSATNPFFIGNTGVTIQAGFNDPTVTLPPAISGSLYLREDGYANQGLYMFRPDGFWHLIGTSVGPASINTITFSNGSNVTNSSTPVRIGARDVDMSFFPNAFNSAPRAVYFKAVVEVTTGAATCQIQLVDVTNNVVVTSTLGSTSSTNLVLFNSGSLIVGNVAGNIRNDMIAIYEVRLAMTSGDVTSDFAICTDARLEITYL